MHKTTNSRTTANGTGPEEENMGQTEETYQCGQGCEFRGLHDDSTAAGESGSDLPSPAQKRQFKVPRSDANLVKQSTRLRFSIDF